MSKQTVFVMLSILLIVLGGFFFIHRGGSSTGSTITGGSVGVPTVEDNIQRITLGVQDGNYAPSTIRVLAGLPVEITLDKSASGCYQSFVIRDLDVAQYSKSPGDRITFTPQATGSYKFSCGMGMGYGTLVVE